MLLARPLITQLVSGDENVQVNPPGFEVTVKLLATPAVLDAAAPVTVTVARPLPAVALTVGAPGARIRHCAYKVVLAKAVMFCKSEYEVPLPFATVFQLEKVNPTSEKPLAVSALGVPATIPSEAVVPVAEALFLSKVTV